MKVKATVLMMVVVGISVPCLFAGNQSLGELARQERLRREKQTAKIIREFTNENIPPPTPWEAVSTTGPAPTETKTAEPPKAAAPEAAPAERKMEEVDKKETKEYWEGRFKAARQRLARAEELLQLSEDELSLLRLQQARELASDVQLTISSKIAGKLVEVDTNRSDVARAREELDALEQEFKESGAPEDWHPPEEKSGSQ